MLKVQFQGGFCGKESEICFKNGSDEVLTHNFYPKGRIDLIFLIFRIFVQMTMIIKNL